MNKFLLQLLMCLITVSVFAQDTVKKYNKISDFNEEFMVLKSNKKMRQGTYQLFYKRKLAAIGKYDQGKRSGLWNYYSDGTLVQQFDFTTNKVTSSIPEKGITYTVDADQEQPVANPVAIGGLTANLKLLAAYTDYASTLAEMKGRITVLHSVSLDNDGKIIKWTTIFKGEDGVKVTQPSFADIPQEMVLFVPATVNNVKAASVISFQDNDRMGEGHEIGVTETKVVARPAGGGRGRP